VVGPGDSATTAHEVWLLVTTGAAYWHRRFLVVESTVPGVTVQELVLVQTVSDHDSSALRILSFTCNCLVVASINVSVFCSGDVVELIVCVFFCKAEISFLTVSVFTSNS
jgi:hypothetical protein